VGVPDPHKRPELAIEALAEYKRIGGRGRLAFVGYHPPAVRQQLVALAERRDVIDSMDFFDRIDDSALAALYGQGILLAVSLYEGFGLPPVECLLAGGRVVAVPNGIYREVLGDGASFAADDSPDSIAQSMIAAETTPPQLESVQVLARRYSPVTVGESLIRLYESLLP